MIFEFVNDIPDDLPPGKYMTKVIECVINNGQCVIRLEFIPNDYNITNPCLFPLTKE